jgi:uncharacterized protein
MMITMLSERDLASLSAENERMKEIEKASDVLVFKIKAEITTGSVSTHVLDSLLSCADTSDGLIDGYYFASREIHRMASIEHSQTHYELAKEMSPILLNLLERCEEAIAILEKLLTAKSIDEVMAEREKIESIEEKGDDIKDHGFDLLYKFAAGINYLDFVHYSELLHKFDDILDGCEDLSDIVLSIITTITR